MDTHDLPLVFGFALVQNPDAMQRFAKLSEARQAAILRQAQAVTSKAEMQALVNGLSAPPDAQG